MEQLNKFIEPLKFQALDRMQSLKFIEEKYKVKPSIVLLIAFVVLLLLTPFLHLYLSPLHLAQHQQQHSHMSK